MTIENNLASIAKSLELIATALTAKGVNPTPVAAPIQVAAPVVTAPIQVAVPAMPAPPTFTPVAAPVFAPTITAPVVPSPFADKSSMMDYVMTSYRALGTEKGAKIQDILTSIGYKNINDVPVEKWADLKAGIESLKG